MMAALAQNRRPAKKALESKNRRSIPVYPRRAPKTAKARANPQRNKE
jgi:hypothetical protein